MVKTCDTISAYYNVTKSGLHMCDSDSDLDDIAKTLAGVKISVSRPKWTAKHPCVAAGVIGQRTSHLTYLVV